jgi:CHAT domain-containing protein
MNQNRAEMLLASVEVASRARSLAPELQPASFNRALAIEAIHVPAQAITAWKDYLAIDQNSGWADEARAHIDRLSQPAPTALHEPNERLATRLESEVLPAWADAFLMSNAVAAGANLRQAEALSMRLGEFHRRAVANVAVASKTNRDLAVRLATAYRQYRDARVLYIANNTAAALPLFESSCEAFRAAGDVFVAKPWKYVAASYLYLGDAERARAEIVKAIALCTQQHCTSGALAHLEWVRGMVAGRGGNPQMAIDQYTEALAGFESAAEFENVAAIRGLIAENLEFLGAFDAAWPHRCAALKSAWQNGTLDHIYIAFGGAARAALKGGYRTSARFFENVVVDAARREHNTVLLADALVIRARTADHAEACRDFAEAHSLASTVADTARRARLLANIASARAEIEEPQRAAESIGEALKFFERVSDHYRLAELYAARGIADEKTARLQLAESDYMNCLHEIESLRSGITNAPVRERFFSRGSSRIFDRVMRYLWATGRKSEAFALAESSRGREIAGGPRLPPVNLRELQTKLRADEALIEYALLEDQMIVWVVRPAGIMFVERPISAATIQSAVNAARDDSRFATAMNRLSSLVYAPVIDAVRDAKRLIIIPNKALRAVSFSALRDPQEARYLVEDHEMVIAPSAAAWAKAAQRDRSLRSAAPPSVLLASYLGGDAARDLPRLESGRIELVSLRALYENVQSLDGAIASPARVLAAAHVTDVVHIVAHAIPNADHPEYASLVLAPSREGADLYAHMIASTSLGSTRLVILSSCGTVGRTTYNDAPLTLPEAFLAAGVPLVIGSLRPVDDALAAEFAIAVHRAYAATGNAVGAVRQAQLDCLHSAKRRNPRAWSSWIVLGGAA